MGVSQEHPDDSNREIAHLLDRALEMHYVFGDIRLEKGQVVLRFSGDEARRLAKKLLS